MHSVTDCSESNSARNSGVNTYLLTTKKIKTYKDFFFLNSLSGNFTVGCKVVANSSS